MDSWRTGSFQPALQGTPVQYALKIVGEKIPCMGGMDFLQYLVQPLGLRPDRIDQSMQNR